MKVNYIKCDACGKEIQGSFSHVSITRQSLSNADFTEEVDMDLCKTCHENVKRFFTPLKDPYGGGLYYGFARKF